MSRLSSDLNARPDALMILLKLCINYYYIRGTQSSHPDYKKQAAHMTRLTFAHVPPAPNRRNDFE